MEDSLIVKKTSIPEIHIENEKDAVDNTVKRDIAVSGGTSPAFSFNRKPSTTSMSKVSTEGSCDSINASPQPSPGYDADLCVAQGANVASPSMNILLRKESYKDQRRKYRDEKKRVARELMSTFKDPSVIVLEDWLKIRGTLKGWTKLWCVLKPNALLLYKSSKAKSSHWKGTVLLNVCELIERPSKKDGFCFKLYHPLEQSIWATKGPGGETIGAMGQPLPSPHLIFRAPSQAAGKCWMDALELAIGCSSLINRTARVESNLSQTNLPSAIKINDEWEIENHFKDQDLDDASHTDENEQHRESGNFSGAEIGSGSESESDYSVKNDDAPDSDQDIEPVKESSYVVSKEGYIGDVGGQTEELADENKSIIWFILKQVRPGMDLSKVVLPTFILEPRSFLDKLADYYYHADIISKAVLEDDPLTRMKDVLRWYLSGFYKKPKGPKKPYNPILGESFRCYWKHPSGSRTFYVAEQVSHHPPVSALYATNRQEGFSVSATILAKSKFYGNSTSAILDGTACLSLLPRGEDYVMNMPYAYCKGILLGTLSIELGGKVTIECEKTGYAADLEFKLKPFLSSGDVSNLVVGKLKLGKETLGSVSGRWDKKIILTDARTGDVEVLWEVTNDVKAKRLQRYTVSLEEQQDFESDKLWQNVTEAIKKDDQETATVEKTILEEAQRAEAKDRKLRNEPWNPKYFVYDSVLRVYMYRYADVRPWDPRADLYQYESDYAISTKTKLKTHIVRTSSIVGVDLQNCDDVRATVIDGKMHQAVREYQSDVCGESSDYGDALQSLTRPCKGSARKRTIVSVVESLQELKHEQECLTKEIHSLKDEVRSVKHYVSTNWSPQSNDNSLYVVIAVGVAILYSFYQWLAARIARS